MILRIMFASVCCLLLLCVGAGTADAQWSSVFGPVGTFTRVQSIASIGSTLFAGTLNGGVYINSDNAASAWTKANTGLTDTSITALAVSGTTLLAGTAHGVFITTDNGTSWTLSSNGLTTTSVSALAVSGSTLLAATFGGGVFVSTDMGAQWNASNAGITGNLVVSMAVNDSFAFVGMNNFAGAEVYRSSDAGANWTPVMTGFPSTSSVNALRSAGNTLVAVVQGSARQDVYASTDNGANWTSGNTGLPSVFSMVLTSSGPNFFVGSYGSGFYLSTDNGANWTAVNNGYGSVPVSALAPVGPYLYAGAFDGGMWRRTISEMATSVNPLAGGVPAEFSLSQNYPNPFNPSTMIRFAIPTEEHVTLQIVNALGQEVGKLLSTPMAAGAYSVEWNSGAHASGVYFYRLSAGEFQQTGKMLLLR